MKNLCYVVLLMDQTPAAKPRRQEDKARYVEW